MIYLQLEGHENRRILVKVSGENIFMKSMNYVVTSIQMFLARGYKTLKNLRLKLG